MIIALALSVWRGGKSGAVGGFEASDYTAESATVWAVGDGADAAQAGLETGLSIPDDIDRFLYLGDVYEDGTLDEFNQNYEPAYGHLNGVAAPTIGNHEWPNFESGYAPYWEEATDTLPPQYYAFKLAGWEFVNLNSERISSRQLEWLEDELSEPGTCRLAYWHTPRYSAGFHPDEEKVEPFWQELEGRAALIVNGHDHNTQRFKPIRGLTQIIAGGGGHELYNVDEGDKRLAFSYDTGTSALRIELEPGRAEYEVVADEGVIDRGEIGCEKLPPGPS